MAAAQAESATASDTSNGAVGGLIGLQVEGASAADSQSTSVTMAAAQLEAASALDAQTVASNQASTQAESASATDASNGSVGSASFIAAQTAIASASDSSASAVAMLAALVEYAAAIDVYIAIGSAQVYPGALVGNRPVIDTVRASRMGGSRPNRIARTTR